MDKRAWGGPPRMACSPKSSPERARSTPLGGVCLHGEGASFPPGARTLPLWAGAALVCVLASSPRAAVMPPDNPVAPASIVIEASDDALDAHFGPSTQPLVPAAEDDAPIVALDALGGNAHVVSGCAGIGDAWLDPAEVLALTPVTQNVGGRRLLMARVQVVAPTAAAVRLQAYVGSTRVATTTANLASLPPSGTHPQGNAFEVSITSGDLFDSVRLDVISGAAALCSSAGSPAARLVVIDPAHALRFATAAKKAWFSYADAVQPIVGNGPHWKVASPSVLGGIALASPPFSQSIPSYSGATKRLGVQSAIDNGGAIVGESGVDADSIAPGEVLSLELATAPIRRGVKGRWLLVRTSGGGAGAVEMLDGGAVVATAGLSGSPGTWQWLDAGGALFSTVRFSATSGAYGIQGLFAALEPTVGPTCFANADCAADSTPCAPASCVAGTCVSTTIDCDDGNACTLDGCAGGACTHAPLECDDGNPCTTDSCDPSKGCLHGRANLGTIACGLGACKHPIPACTNGKPTACDAKTGASPELCDGEDNDCDGATDENWPLLGSSCTSGFASCKKGGVFVCASDAYSMQCSAVPSSPPSPADTDCNGVDDDCDGLVDEDFAESEVTCGVGACAGTVGLVTCIGGNKVNTCDPFAFAAPKDASCDGVDDDCDGLTDENHVSKSTKCGVGPCMSTGNLKCVSGELVDTCAVNTAAAATSDESCDAVDSDCDGQIDEDFEAGKITCGAGTCKNVGTVSCIGGLVKSTCEPLAPLSSTDSNCDGLDDNCNGTIDEGCPVPPGCDLGYEPCPILPPTQPPTLGGKETCKVADSAYCSYFASSIHDYDDFVQATSGIVSTPLKGGSIDVQCYLYGATSCLSCVYPTLSFCAAPSGLPGNPCYDVALAACPLVQEVNCPTATLTKCGSNAFYANHPLLLVYPSACTSTVQAACDAIFAANCPATSTLDACAPLMANLAAVSPTACQQHVVRKCSQTLTLQCPAIDVALCAAVDAGTAAIHPACATAITAGCEDWQETLCPPLIGIAVDPTTCATQYPLLTAPHVPAACREWVDAKCPDVIADSAQTSYEGGVNGQPGCDTLTVKEEDVGFAYDIVDSVSNPSEFDCGPTEVLPEHPHDQQFELTTLEAILTALPVAALNQQISGLSVESCDEYVKQKYYDYYRFQAFTTLFETDSRRVWQAGYTDTPGLQPYAIGRRAAYLATVAPIGGFPNGYPQIWPAVGLSSETETNEDFKNDYARITSEPYAGLYAALMNYSARAPVFMPPQLVQQKQASLDSLDDSLQDARHYWFKSPGYGLISGWAWHWEMSERLRDQGISDEEIATQYQRRKQFRELLDRWRALEDKRLALMTFVLSPSNPHYFEWQERLSAIAAAKSAIVEEVDARLFEVRARGCFDTVLNGVGEPMPSVCDWAPADWMDQVDRVFAARIEADRRSCMRWVPADFSSITAGYTYLYASGNQIVSQFTGVNPTASIGLLEQYIARMKETQQLQGAYFQQIPVAERPIYGQSWGDSETLGDPSYFAIAYSYDAGWSLDVPPVEINVCKLAAAAYANFDCNLVVIDEPFSILDAGVVADTEAGDFESHFRVFGVEFWQEGGAGVGPTIPDLHYDLNLVYDGGTAEKSEGDSAEVPVFSFAGIDIVMRAGYSGKVGLESDGFLKFGANFNGQECTGGVDLDVGFTARPYAALDGFIEAGLDLWLVEFGVGGSLNIVSASLPVSVSIHAEADADLQATNATLSVDTDAQLDVSTLSGQLYFYADTFWKTYKRTFFRWDGYQWTVDLFSKSFDFNLGLTVAYCLSFDCFE